MMSSNEASSSANATKSPLREIRKKAARGSGGLRKRTNSAPGRISSDDRRRRLLVEDYYRVDPSSKRLLPGLPVNDDDWARDLHDFFNLICLVPVVVLNIMNWNWDILLDLNSKKTMEQAWTGEWFPLFYAITIGYFVADLIWVLMVPHCVKSPGVILQHHVATLIYLIIPYRFPVDGWLMGSCLSVEVNTWLLIARRVFNKQGFGPWVLNISSFSIRIKIISILFYVTWFSIRCFIYPIILKTLWFKWKDSGAIFHTRYSMALFLHIIFCLLNFKWTFDLFMSRWRALTSGKQAIEKGL